MSEVRILHAADLHLDSPFEALGEAKAVQRRAEQRELLTRLTEMAGELRADMLFLAGDLLDGAGAYAETRETLGTALGRLTIPVFLAPGNHDYYSPRSPYARLRLPENVHIFRRPVLECVTLPSLGVRVWGAGYTEPSCPPLLRDFSLEKTPGLLDVLILHAEVGARADSPYCPVSEEELERSGFDYAGFGHIHKYSGVRRAGHTVYAWPGCPEGRGFDECGEKGVVLASVSENACEAEFLPLGTRRYEILEVPVGGDALHAALSALPADAARHIFRVVLTGECSRRPDLEKLQHALEERVFALSFRDRTVLHRDIWECCSEDSLRGLFLRRLRAAWETAEDEAEREKIVMAVRAGLAALEEGEGEL